MRLHLFTVCHSQCGSLGIKCNYEAVLMTEEGDIMTDFLHEIIIKFKSGCSFTVKQVKKDQINLQICSHIFTKPFCLWACLQ